MSSPPEEIRIYVARRLDAEVRNFTATSGGCINNGGCLSTSSGDFFIKWNSAAKFPRMFAAESGGLQLLLGTQTVRAPQVVLTGETGAFQFIVMEWIGGGRKSKTYWEDLGIQLAALHRNSASSFGLDHDNYIGSLPQRNTQENSWLDFFVKHRIQPQLDLLRADAQIRKRFDLLFRQLPQLIPPEPPALIHGDLWGGNLITGHSGQPCVIDPAVHFGHRESELAFTGLFGGFEQSFYRSYATAFPLQKGFDERADIYNLYPLLVHANLFGGSYLQQVKGIIGTWA